MPASGVESTLLKTRVSCAWPHRQWVISRAKIACGVVGTVSAAGSAVWCSILKLVLNKVADVLGGGQWLELRNPAERLAKTVGSQPPCFLHCHGRLRTWCCLRASQQYESVLLLQRKRRRRTRGVLQKGSGQLSQQETLPHMPSPQAWQQPSRADVRAVGVFCTPCSSLQPLLCLEDQPQVHRLVR